MMLIAAAEADGRNNLHLLKISARFNHGWRMKEVTGTAFTVSAGCGVVQFCAICRNVRRYVMQMQCVVMMMVSAGGMLSCIDRSGQHKLERQDAQQ